jgi:hypothetical protein
MTLSSAEKQLINLLRAGAPFAVTIVLPEAGGELVASTSTPPFEDQTRARVGCGFSFDEAWNARRAVPTI